jgi:hypothetical protein
MLYEIIFNVIASLLIVKYRDRVRVQGDLLKRYLLAAALFRFLVEYVRGAPEMAWGLTSAQIALIPITLLLVLYFVRQWRRGVYAMPAPPMRTPIADYSSLVVAPLRLAPDPALQPQHAQSLHEEIAVLSR